METFNHFINGEIVEPANGEYIDTDNPYTGEIWGQIARGTAADVDRAVEAAAAAFEGWKATSPTSRGKLLNKLADLIERDADHLGQMEVRDNGKLIAEMGAQAKITAEWYRYYGGLADNCLLYTSPSPRDKRQSRMPSSA